MRRLPTDPDYLGLAPQDELATRDLVGVLALHLAAVRQGDREHAAWYRDLALSLASHFELRPPAVMALLSGAGADDLAASLVHVDAGGSSAVLGQLFRARDRIRGLPQLWSGSTGEPFSDPLGDAALERLVDGLAGAVLAHADAGITLLRELDAAIVALWTGDPGAVSGRVPVARLCEEGLELR